MATLYFVCAHTEFLIHINNFTAMVFGACFQPAFNVVGSQVVGGRQLCQRSHFTQVLSVGYSSVFLQSLVGSGPTAVTQEGLRRHRTDTYETKQKGSHWK